MTTADEWGLVFAIALSVVLFQQGSAFVGLLFALHSFRFATGNSDVDGGARSDLRSCVTACESGHAFAFHPTA